MNENWVDKIVDALDEPLFANIAKGASIAISVLSAVVTIGCLYTMLFESAWWLVAAFCSGILCGVSIGVAVWLFDEC